MPNDESDSEESEEASEGTFGTPYSIYRKLIALQTCHCGHLPRSIMMKRVLQVVISAIVLS